MAKDEDKLNRVVENQIWKRLSDGKRYRARVNSEHNAILSSPLDALIGVNRTNIPIDCLLQDWTLIKEANDHDYSMSIYQPSLYVPNFFDFKYNYVISLYRGIDHILFPDKPVAHPESLVSATVDIRNCKAFFGVHTCSLWMNTKEFFENNEQINLNRHDYNVRDRLRLVRIIDDVTRTVVRRSSISSDNIAMPLRSRCNQTLIDMGFRPQTIRQMRKEWDLIS